MPYDTVKRSLSVLAVAAAVALAPATLAAADFSGKKITIVVPFKEGGGADVYARLFAPYLEKHLPGNPTILVRNQPGGGSVKGANKFYKDAKPDGTAAMALSTSSLVNFVLGGKKVKYNVLDFRPVVLSPRGTVFYVSPKTGAKGKDIATDVKALQGTKLNFGAKTPTSSELRAVLAFEMLEIKNVNVVFGLSSGKQRKAFLREELNINYDSAGAYSRKVMKYVEKGKAVPLMTMGYGKPDGSIGRDPAFPDMPTVLEAYQKVHGSAPTGHTADAFKNFLHMGVSASKSLVLPKGTPDDVVATWTEAAKKVVADADFRKKAKKVLGAYPQAYGDDAAKILKLATDVDPETKKWLKAFVKKRFNVNI